MCCDTANRGEKKEFYVSTVRVTYTVLYQPSPSGSRAARAARVRCRLALERCVRHSALPACALQCAGTLGSPPRQWRHADTGASHAKQ